MLMLYLFKIEVFDLDFQYTYAIDRVVIADTREDRRRLIGKQFGAHNGSIVRRSVLLGARRLTVDEVRLLKTSFARTAHVWLVTRIRPSRQKVVGRSLPRLSDEKSMQELLKRPPAYATRSSSERTSTSAVSGFLSSVREQPLSGLPPEPVNSTSEKPLPTST